MRGGGVNKWGRRKRKGGKREKENKKCERKEREWKRKKNLRKTNKNLGIISLRNKGKTTNPIRIYTPDKVGTLSFYTLNMYWFSLMLKGCVKAVRRKGLKDE